MLQVHDELVLEVAPGEREAVEALVRRTAPVRGSQALVIAPDGP
jgi:DNA polymerase I-like protein with 3'-5' exonuclease and polymerase domains